MQLFRSLGCFTRACFKGIRVSEHALFGAAQIALERSRRRRGRRIAALGAPTSRFAPPPPRALIPVINTIPFDSVISSGAGLLLSPSYHFVTFYLIGENYLSLVTFYYKVVVDLVFSIFSVPLKHFRFKDLQQLQVLISKGQALVGTSLQF